MEEVRFNWLYLTSKSSTKTGVESTERKRSASRVPINTRHLTNFCLNGSEQQKNLQAQLCQGVGGYMAWEVTNHHCKFSGMDAGKLDWVAPWLLWNSN